MGELGEEKDIPTKRRGGRGNLTAARGEESKRKERNKRRSERRERSRSRINASLPAPKKPLTFPSFSRSTPTSLSSLCSLSICGLR